MNIILIGFKSCGKSITGRALAQSVGMAFVDTDTLLEELHTTTQSETLSFREIYKKYGKVYFLELEQRVIDHIGQLDNYVIAAGGGTFVNHSFPNEIRLNARVVYLEVAPDILLNRIKASGIPAFFKGLDPREDFERFFNERVPTYVQLADHIINVSNCSVDQVVEQIRHSLGL